MRVAGNGNMGDRPPVWHCIPVLSHHSYSILLSNHYSWHGPRGGVLCYMLQEFQEPKETDIHDISTNQAKQKDHESFHRRYNRIHSMQLSLFDQLSLCCKQSSITEISLRLDCT